VYFRILDRDAFSPDNVPDGKNRQNTGRSSFGSSECGVRMEEIGRKWEADAENGNREEKAGVTRKLNRRGQ
jgi:hypothetical protein